MRANIKRKISICTARVTTIDGDVYQVNVPADDAIRSAREAVLELHEVYSDDIEEITIMEGRERSIYVPTWKFVAIGCCEE